MKKNNSNKVMKNGKQIVFKLVKPNSIYEETVTGLSQIDDIVMVDVYEGYKKLGRFRLKDARLKFK